MMVQNTLLCLCKMWLLDLLKVNIILKYSIAPKDMGVGMLDLAKSCEIGFMQ